jgi:hypothetical protein
MTVDRTLTRQELDRVSCDEPDCDHTAHDGLYLHGNCHPSEPTWAVYNAVSGTLTIECAVCGNDIIRIAVAEGPDPDQTIYGYEACWHQSEDGHCRLPKGHEGPHIPVRDSA